MLHLTAAVAAGLVLGAVGIGILFLRRQRRCTQCGNELTTVAHPDGLHTYEVLVCERCPSAEVLSNGTRNRFAFCPRCGRRGLEVLPERLADPPGGVLVHVSESCQVCGYGDQRYVSSDLSPSEPDKPGPGSGRVLPFRRKDDQ